jgi:cytochrome c
MFGIPSPRLSSASGRGGAFPSPARGRRCLREARRLAVFALTSLCFVAGSAMAGGLVGDPTRGEQLYQACTDCHSLDQNDVGPRHRGVYGRKAGSLTDYSYSQALKSSNIVWNEETLDKWLTDPQAFVPGVKMNFHLDSAQDRADVIAYLKERAK